MRIPVLPECEVRFLSRDRSHLGTVQDIRQQLLGEGAGDSRPFSVIVSLEYPPAMRELPREVFQEVIENAWVSCVRSSSWHARLCLAFCTRYP